MCSVSETPSDGEKPLRFSSRNRQHADARSISVAAESCAPSGRLRQTTCSASPANLITSPAYLLMPSISRAKYALTYLLSSSAPLRPCSFCSFSDSLVKPETSTKPTAPMKSSRSGASSGFGSSIDAKRCTTSAGE